MPRKPNYHLILQIGSKVYKSSAPTILEALSKLSKPEKIMMWGMLSIKYGKKEVTYRFTIPRLKRLFYAPKYQEIHAKQLNLLLK